MVLLPMVCWIARLLSPSPVEERERAAPLLADRVYPVALSVKLSPWMVRLLDRFGCVTAVPLNWARSLVPGAASPVQLVSVLKSVPVLFQAMVAPDATGIIPKDAIAAASTMWRRAKVRS